MPKSKEKKILITSALPYVNNVPHLGNIVGSVLSADVFARAMRLAKKDVLYICGTDEHGTATEAKAIEENTTPQKLCDKYFKIHENVYKWFNISFDHFGRTSKKNHHKITQDIFLKIVKNGFITEEEIEQVYCRQCDKFLADRFVEGKCPYCENLNAKGDQCDNCGKLLTPLELESPRCSIHGTRPEIRKSKHLFLELEKLQPSLEKWAAKQSKTGRWTENTIKITNAWFKEGLKKRAITRDLKWGISVPYKGYENKVFYVWFDAPIGYISITEDKLKDDYKKWWYAPENVELYQFMGKDNIPFHSIIFPGTEIAAKDKFTFVHHINATEYLNYEGGKFSKSKGTGVFGDDAINSGVPSDVYRYYLMAIRPETSDAEFNWDKLRERLHNELVGNFGNLVNRFIAYSNRAFNSEIENAELDTDSKRLWEKIIKEEKEVLILYEGVQLREALKKIMEISSLGNEYFQKREPWKNITENKKHAQITMRLIANIVKDLAILMAPYLPESCGKIVSQMKIKKGDFSELGKLSIKKHKLGKAEILFNKMEDKFLAQLKKKFAGKISEKDPFEKLDLVVGKIISVEKHPNADKLFVEKIDLGKEQRIIVSGLAKHYKPEELKGKNVIIIANLKSAELRGVKSSGMLLAAEKNGELKVLEAPNSKPGDNVFAEGMTSSPEKEINIGLFSQVKLSVKQGRIFYKNNKLKTSHSDVVCNVADGAEVK
ncbi:TPA: methionine--tRNA ligase [Candidatus Woesearchaeota archaeon]|nr:methionine--tRNA ligase [Candidatus Woesearchaeota archaeon]HIH39699.1 methionine--tRNA ligase [Candidatus Woesearchaeota archaeon]